MQAWLWRLDGVPDLPLIERVWNALERTLMVLAPGQAMMALQETD
jgi:hypothetical protein